MKLVRILQLRPPAWEAVKRNVKKHIHTRSGIIWSVITGLTTLCMLTAFAWPHSETVQFVGGFSLACFFPMLAVLLIRKWNRTLAFPAALIFGAIPIIALFYNFNLNDALISVFLIMTFLIGATSDRLSFIYKWKPPFNYIGITAAAVLIFFLVYLAFMVLFVAALLFIVGILLVFLLIRSMFGHRRHRRWY